MKLIQSEKRFTLTVTTLTYVAIAEITNNVRAVIPRGNPNITSVTIPDKNMNPFPKISGRLKTQ